MHLYHSYKVAVAVPLVREIWVLVFCLIWKWIDNSFIATVAHETMNFTVKSDYNKMHNLFHLVLKKSVV